MKALVLTEASRFEYRETPDLDVGRNDVLIRVKACGICGSDVHGMDGSTGRRRPPIVMGHEAAGVIVEVGPDVVGWNEGDRVTFDSTIYCGRCRFCRGGRINLCDNRRVLGVSCDAYRQDGAFAEYVKVPSHILYRLPDTVSFRRGAMVEAVSIAVHAVGRSAVTLNDAAVVVGTGVIGLFVVQTLRAAGCGTIIAADLDAGRLALSRELGADVAVRTDQEDLREAVLSATDGRGADIAMEVVGVSAALQAAVAALRKGGRLTLVGNLSPNVDFPLQSVVTREISVNGSCASCGEYPACLDLMARDAIRVDPLISATAPLSDGAEWFQRLYEREPGLLKVLLEPDGD